MPSLILLLHDYLYCFRTNVQNFALYIVLIQDNNGTGRPVGFMFLKREDKESVRWGLMQFISASLSMSRTRVVFVDKDFNEITAITELLPAVDVLLCQFHVIKHVKKEISQLVLDVSEKNTLLSLFKTLLHSATQVSCF